MNMRKVFTLILVALLFSCSDSVDEPSLTISPSIVGFSKNATTKNITVVANQDWTFTTPNEDWLTVSKPNNESLTITVMENPLLEKRSTSLVVECNGIVKKVQIDQYGSNLEVTVDTAKIEATYEGGMYDIVITANTDYEVWQDDKDKWLKIDKTKDGLTIIVDGNLGNERTSKVNITDGVNVYATISIIQSQSRLEIKKDSKVTIIRAEASDADSQEPIENSFDGETSTLYHSTWNRPAQFPVSIKYYFDTDVDRIDYLMLYGRGWPYNGNLGEFDINVKTQKGEIYKHSSQNFDKEGGQKLLQLGIEIPDYIELIVKSGYADFVSIAEIEFYKKGDSNTPPDIFTDISCSKLKQGVTIEEIGKVKDFLFRKIAIDLFNNTYDSEYRAKTYKAITNIDIIQNKLRVGDGFSKYQNVTGMFLEKGEHIVIVGETKGKNISLRLPNFETQEWGLPSESILLQEGVNVVNVKYDANAYITYYDGQPAKAPEIIVNFPTAKVNKYFDIAKNTNADWVQILQDAPSKMMDMVGNYVHVTYPVERFKELNNNHGKELIETYDLILKHHYTMLGCFKYDIVPENKIYARSNNTYYMFRDNDGVSYLSDISTMKMVITSESVRTDGAWGFSHEVGHVLQTPQFNWPGMGEVSNNMFSMYTTLKLGNPSNLSQSGTYAKARATIIDKKISYLQADDFFYRLVPFWQLYLYFEKNGYTDYYADIWHEMRKHPLRAAGEEHKYMFDFIKIASDIGKTDLTDFFQSWGFFKVGDYEIDDYGIYKFSITKKEVNEIKEYIKSKEYLKPNEDITLIED